MMFSKTACRSNIYLLVILALLTGCAGDSISFPSGYVAPYKRTEKIADNKRSIDTPLETLSIERRDWETSEPLSEKQHLSDRTMPNDQPPLNGAASTPDKKLSVNAIDMKLSTLLFALAEESGFELELHESLESLVTFSARDASLPQILSRLAMQTPMHWQVRQGVLHVWGSAFFTETYPINYLNISRSLTSNVGLATEVGTMSSVDGLSSNVSNSSETEIKNRAEQDFWSSLQSDVKLLLTAVDRRAAVSLNRDAGFITLHAGFDSHAALRVYLSRLNIHSDRQVLIQASVVEVVLNDDYSAGIDWRIIGKGLSALNAAQVLNQSPTVLADTIQNIPSPAGLLSWIYSDKDVDFQATVNLLEQFGDVRIVSRPQILALNNQSAVLKVVDNRVYFAVDIERRRTDERDEISTKTEIKTVPVGLVMHVTPFVGDNGSVMLNIRPTLSRILGFVNDPNPELAAASIKNGVPEIQVREMESVLRMNNGETAIIGGLIQDSTDIIENRIPLLGQLPVVGALFRSILRVKKKSELVILIHPTVMS